MGLVDLSPLGPLGRSTSRSPSPARIDSMDSMARSDPWDQMNRPWYWKPRIWLVVTGCHQFFSFSHENVGVRKHHPNWRSFMIFQRGSNQPPTISGWWFGCHQFYFPINIGLLSSSQLTFTFFRGVAQPTTTQIYNVGKLVIHHPRPQGLYCWAVPTERIFWSKSPHCWEGEKVGGPSRTEHHKDHKEFPKIDPDRMEGCQKTCHIQSYTYAIKNDRYNTMSGFFAYTTIYIYIYIHTFTDFQISVYYLIYIYIYT